jgi:hypothetical protein
MCLSDIQTAESSANTPVQSQIKLGPVNRARLARYLEVPSAGKIDPITDEEIRKLDARREELLSCWQCAVTLPVAAVADHSVVPGEFLRQLRYDGAEVLVVCAFTIGSRVDDEIKQHLDQQDVYEAFVLKQWAATMTEQARVAVTNRLRSWAESAGRSILPFSGPGYDGWPLTALRPLLELVYRGADVDERPIRATENGVLLPTNSMLIVHGVTSQAVRMSRQESLAQCHRCSMRHCRYRVAPFAELACSG